MSKPNTVEAKLLSAAEAFIVDKTRKFSVGLAHEARLQLLEAAACRIGTHTLSDYQKAFGFSPLMASAASDSAAEGLLKILQATPIPTAFALSALAREPLTSQRQKETGAYYTDFRLAQFLGGLAAKNLDGDLPVIDPACGTGILLCGLTAAVCGPDRRKAASWLANRVQACALSPQALRGALLSLATFTDDLSALVKMRSSWFCGDSLLRDQSAWARSAPAGYARVIANPPWEKVKLSKLEFAQSNGSKAHYGQSLTLGNALEYQRQRSDTLAYASALAARYPLASAGEVDLYAAFTELFTRLAAKGGSVSALLPASLIRAQGAQGLREVLFGRCRLLEVHVVHNQSKFFAIDSRFKFIALNAQMDDDVKGKKKALSVCLSHPTSNAQSVTPGAVECISGSVLRRLRPDLSLPEVRSAQEWSLYRRASENGVSAESHADSWTPDFCREVDMTRERALFQTRPSATSLPVVEGRMVHQHRFGVKAYQHGTGRKAIWQSLQPGMARVAPQFWIEEGNLPQKVCNRSRLSRAGFCDIAGQTNERSMMAAIIPPGVVCGNKVPTVLFADDPDGDKALLWVCMVNSFAFDWLLRRVLTTTVNYFLLRSIPLPNISTDSLPGKRAIALGRELIRLEQCGKSRETAWQMAEVRAQIDFIMLKAYGLSADDMRLILSDFPALDRSQPELPNEERSTITSDFLIWKGWGLTLPDGENRRVRVEHAKRLGAVPYIPSQIEISHDDSAVKERAA